MRSGECVNFRATTEQKPILGKYNVKNARKPFQYELSFWYSLKCY